MKEFSASIDINASPETIWKILTDASKYIEWDANMLKLEGTIAPAQKLTIYTKLAPNRAFTPTVVEFDTNRKMVWSSGMPLGLFKGARTFTLEPLGDGRTRFSMRETFTGLLEPMISGSIPDMNPVFAEFASALKKRAENAA
jgi:hypothetical protein